MNDQSPRGTACAIVRFSGLRGCPTLHALWSPAGQRGGEVRLGLAGRALLGPGGVSTTFTQGAQAFGRAREGAAKLDVTDRGAQ